MSNVQPPPAPPASSFFGKLFNPNFDESITPSVVKVFYILMMAGTALTCLFSFVNLVNGDPGAGWVLLGLALILLLGLLYIMFIRLILETIMVLFKIEENTRRS